MFELNPLNLPDAMWQQIVMLVVAAILGYIIGYRGSRKVAVQLEAELDELDGALIDCRESKAISVPAAPAAVAEVPPVVPVAAPAEPVKFVAPEPIDRVVTAPSAKPPAGVPVAADNLKLVEGIGSKIEELLNKEGILTFRHLGDAPHEQLVDILRAAGKRFRMHDPGTWPRQAEMAADGRWDELKAWQDVLSKGRIIK